MVVSQHYLATDVGHSILESGGNAYDASVAVAFALAVVLPRAGNIGGGGFMVLYHQESNKNYSIDYREMAPELATKDMYLNQDGSVNKDQSNARYSCHWSSRNSLWNVGSPSKIWEFAME